jgi:hypothetical protein
MTAWLADGNADTHLEVGRDRPVPIHRHLAGAGAGAVTAPVVEGVPVGRCGRDGDFAAFRIGMCTHRRVGCSTSGRINCQRQRQERRCARACQTVTDRETYDLITLNLLVELSESKQSLCCLR